MDEQRGSGVGQSAPSRLIESIIADRLEPAPEASAFPLELEELARSYSLELPFRSGGHLSQLFRFFPGRRAAGTSGDGDDEGVVAGGAASADECGSRARSRRGGKLAARKGLSWCRLLGLGRRRGASLGGCCLAHSDTRNNFVISHSDNAIDSRASAAPSASSSIENLVGMGSAASAGSARDELTRDAMELLGPLASELRRGSWADSVRASSPRRNLLESEAPLEPASRVSVCLLDKRKHRARIKLELSAEGARRSAMARAQLARVERRLVAAWSEAPAGSSLKTRARLTERLADRLVARLNGTLARAERSSRSRGASARADRAQVGALVELTKVSLNNLIDAQLLLRNKLKLELRQQQSGPATSSGAISMAGSAALGGSCATFGATGGPFAPELHDSLLRNNFNLLKIWQNLEETKRLACFVCEPIKASLADLFWFSRERSRLAHLVCGPSSDLQLLTSPLVSLDAIQVKCGLIQVSSHPCTSLLLLPARVVRAPRRSAIQSDAAQLARCTEFN